MNVIRSVRHSAGVWLHYFRMGWKLRGVAADFRSRWLLPYLGATTLFRSTILWRGRRGVRVRVRIGPKTFPIRLRARTELTVLREIALEDEYRPSDTIAAQTIVDLGAHIGVATLRLLAVRPDARVVAVEPDPKLIPRLRENVEGLPVTVVHAAISDSTGERVLYRSDVASWGNSLVRTSPDQTPVRVPTLSLRDLLDAHGIDRVDLLKVDIEGAEWSVFEDAVPSNIDAIVGEAHAQGAQTADRFLERLSREMHVTEISSGPGQATFIATRDREGSS